MDNRFADLPDDTEDTSPEGTEDAVDAALGADEGETTRLNVRVPTPLYERFKDKSKSEGRTMSWYVLQWVRDYVTD